MLRHDSTVSRRWVEARFVHCLLLLGMVLVGCPIGLTPVLGLSTSALSFDQEDSSGLTTLSNEGGGTLIWEILSAPDWLTMTPSSGSITTADQVVTFHADFTGLPAGNYTGEVVFASNGGNRTVVVSATVTAPPVLEVTPALPLDFGSAEDTQQFTVANTGTGTLNWSLTQPLPTGFAASTSTGILTSGATQTVTLTVDRLSLPDGFSSADIEITSNGGSATVTVRASVQPLIISPSTLDFGSEAGALSFTLSNGGTSNLTWSIDSTSLPSWASVSSGGLTGTLEPDAEIIIEVTVDRTGLAPEGDEGLVSITSDGGDGQVTLLIEGEDPVLQVTPAQLDFGSALVQDTFVVRNRGTGILSWSIQEGVRETGAWVAEDAAWLSVDVTSGETRRGEVATVTVTVDRSQVTPREDEAYLAYLRISSLDGDEEFVSVSLLALPPTLRATPQNLAFGTGYVTRQLAIWNGGLGTVNWEVDTTTSPAWVTVSPVDAGGIASGTVGGLATDALVFSVDRAGYEPADEDYSWAFDITGVDGDGATVSPLSIEVSMNVARVPAIGIDTTIDGNPNVDGDGIAYVPFGTREDTATFTISNQGTGTLSWSIDASLLPSWVRQMDPSQGTLESLETELVTVTIDRTDLVYGSYQQEVVIESNDPERPEVIVRLEMQVAKRISIGIRPSSVDFGLYGVSSSFDVANLGDPGSLLNFQVESNKDWLYFYPETGQSEGTDSTLKDWREVDISIDRGQLDGTGGSGILTVTAFEVDEFGNRVTLDDVEPASVTVSVEAAELSFETAYFRTRIPSLVQSVVLMRDLTYRSLPLPDADLDFYAEGFSIFEQDEPVELVESGRFLKSMRNVRTDLVVLLDYSGSMYEAAGKVSDTSISGADDPLQALYELCAGQLISELPDNYNVALMEFHDRSQASRVVTAPDYGPQFTRDKAILLQRLENLDIVDHGATEFLPALEEATDVLNPYISEVSRIAFDDAGVRGIVAITDGRLTTPPAKVKDTLDYVFGRYVRFMGVGWGTGVLHEPLARIAAGTGGHYYPTLLENTGIEDDDGNQIKIPQVSALMDWCETDDPGLDPCDQSVPKDLKSQVLFGYVTLRTDDQVKVSVEAVFDDPNDDDNLCLDDQRTISGSMVQTKHDFISVEGDVNMGQISLHSEGVDTGTARVRVRADYVPRNIDSLRLMITSTEFFTASLVPNDEDGLIEDWTLADVGGGQYLLSAPEDGGPLAYGNFGDLLYLDFPAVLSPFDVSFAVLDPVYDAADAQCKYFCAPASITVTDEAVLAPAFPTPDLVNLTVAAGADSWTIEIRNEGGSHSPTGVLLYYEVTNYPSEVTVTPEAGWLESNTEVQQLDVQLSGSKPAKELTDPVVIMFYAGTLNTPAVTGYVYLTE